MRTLFALILFCVTFTKRIAAQNSSLCEKWTSWADIHQNLGIIQPEITNENSCKKACENNNKCFGVDWLPKELQGKQCELHFGWKFTHLHPGATHWELNRSGKCSDCGNTTFFEPSGKISSPNFPSVYYNNLTCNYTIEVSDANSVVVLKFTAFDTEPNQDYVMIYCASGQIFDSPLYSGYNVPGDLTVPSCNRVVVSFTTDSDGPFHGFSLDYEVRLGNQLTIGLSVGAAILILIPLIVIFMLLQRRRLKRMTKTNMISGRQMDNDEHYDKIHEYNDNYDVIRDECTHPLPDVYTKLNGSSANSYEKINRLMGNNEKYIGVNDDKAEVIDSDYIHPLPDELIEPNKPNNSYEKMTREMVNDKKYISICDDNDKVIDAESTQLLPDVFIEPNKSDSSYEKINRQMANNENSDKVSIGKNENHEVASAEGVRPLPDTPGQPNPYEGLTTTY